MRRPIAMPRWRFTASLGTRHWPRDFRLGARAGCGLAPCLADLAPVAVSCDQFRRGATRPASTTSSGLGPPAAWPRGVSAQSKAFLAGWASELRCSASPVPLPPGALAAEMDEQRRQGCISARPRGQKLEQVGIHSIASWAHQRPHPYQPFLHAAMPGGAAAHTLIQTGLHGLPEAGAGGRLRR